jgi:hypothetical protein
MKPTIGRMVHYTDALHHSRPAIVTSVHHDEKTVDLAVFWTNKMEFRLGIKHDEDRESKTWHWPPREV